MSSIQRLKRLLSDTISGSRRSGLGRLFARISRSYLIAFNNVGSHSIRSGGEARVLQTLGDYSITRNPRIFDVGANRGDWTLEAAASFPEGVIHAFEPVTNSYSQLCQTIELAGLEARVTPHMIGFDAEIGESQISLYSASVLSSLVDGKYLAGAADLVKVIGEVENTETVSLSTIDSFCLKEGIEEIFFLKIDTEGWDHNVLSGAQRMLSEGRVTVIQFEYGPWAISTRFLLKDFYNLLGAYGYVIGKIFPKAVEFGHYGTDLEDFRGLNYLAVRINETQLVAKLS
jgi:FkbM family methyltransferase